MSFLIGNVLINDDYYTGADEYSDGPIEDEFLEIAKRGNFEEMLKKDNRWPVLYHFSDIRENLLEWYPFSSEGELLEIGAGCGALTGLFCRKVKQVTAVELSMKRSMVNAYRNHSSDNLEILVGNYEEIEPSLGLFDYITLIGVWEYSALYITGSNPYTKMLLLAKKHLKPGGKIFIAIENKMGIKYWNGAVEDHIGRQFVSLQNYTGYNNVRTFSKPEIEAILHEQYIEDYTFYYPMPDYKLPEVTYSDEMLPQPGLERNYKKDYSSSRQYLFNDAIIMDQISSDKMFPYFANSFLVVVGESKPKVSYSKYNKQRRSSYRTKIEIIRNNDGSLFVKKTPLTDMAKNHVMSLKDKDNFCIKSGLPMISPKGYWDGVSYIMEYVDADDLVSKLYREMKVPELIDRFKNMRKICYESAKVNKFYYTPEYSKWFGELYPKASLTSMNMTNVDLTLSNLKSDKNGKIICVDNEWVFNFPIPVDYVVWRSINELYGIYCSYLNVQMSMYDFAKHVGIDSKDWDVYMSMEKNFNVAVFGVDGVERYLNNYVK